MFNLLLQFEDCNLTVVEDNANLCHANSEHFDDPLILDVIEILRMVPLVILFAERVSLHSEWDMFNPFFCICVVH